MDAEAAAAQDELLKHRRRQKGPSLQQDVKKLLELPGVLRNGRVHPHYLRHPDMPSSPLRAFSYTQAGGNTACGENINALFKCPAGYNGNYATKKAELRGVDSSERSCAASRGARGRREVFTAAHSHLVSGDRSS